MKFTPKSRQAWRSWLQQNHDSKPEVWLVFYKRHTGKPTLSYNDAVEEAVCFGWIDGVKRSIDDERYTHRFSPRKPASHWASTNRKRAERMRKAGLMTPAGEAAIRRARKNGTWSEPAQTANLSVSPELSAALKRNKAAAAFFESLTRSYQQQFAGWINAAKRPETRQRRLAEAIALLERGEKLGMR